MIEPIIIKCLIFILSLRYKMSASKLPEQMPSILVKGKIVPNGIVLRCKSSNEALSIFTPNNRVIISRHKVLGFLIQNINNGHIR
jgi:hypothetical protein